MLQSIKEKTEKIKGTAKESLVFENSTQKGAFFTVFVLLATCASFGLGRLSGLETVKKEVEVEFPKGQAEAAAIGVAFSTTSAPLAATQKTSGKYVASKNGTKYHLTTCAGAKSISAKNKIWFDSKEEAEKMGYTPASNCKGM